MRSPPPLKGERKPFMARKRAFEINSGDPGWIWGVHAVLAALANRARKVQRLAATRNGAAHLPAGMAFDLLEPADLERLLPPHAVHQGLALKSAPLAPLGLEEACFPPDGRPVLVLDGVTDPQNVGAMFRSAAAFGVRAVILQDRKSPPLTGALAKAAVGAVDFVAHARVVNIARAIEQLGDAGYCTVGLAGEAALPADQALDDPRPIALVVGAEDKGLRQLVGERCERLAFIPMSPAMESLNASVAAAIALYEIARRLPR